MKIVCVRNMPFAEEAFSTLGTTTVLEGRALTADDVRDADLLAIRSTTRVDRGLLEGSRVKFVGTATIGTDHMDIPWLEEQGIAWCSAAGCNANSVSEYFVAALLCLAQRHGFTLAGRTVGVVGVGNVGRLVVQKAEALGLRVLQNDPPRYEQTGDSVFMPLDRILPEADILTLHTPMEKAGAHPTFHLADTAFFQRLKRGCLFVNAARGAIVDSDALLRAMAEGLVAHAVLDTWEGEPAFRTDVLDRADIATPHIAGHSFEGKVMGTVMVYRQACRFLGRAPAWRHEPLMPEPLVPELDVEAGERQPEAVLREIVRRVYDIEADDRRLREGREGGAAARAAHFDALRKNYPMRREFPFTRVRLRGAPEPLGETVRRLGFQVETAG
ncbi:MAG: 4-phosphoerythronate dehydrogenase PdxB [Kiritimatiellae bacterium]|nr:4-phosphoerythronate dehydrogenase PdxB [Kiritimatiellia bacterium]